MIFYFVVSIFCCFEIYLDRATKTVWLVCVCVCLSIQNLLCDSQSLKIGILVTNDLLNFLNKFRISENFHSFQSQQHTNTHTHTCKRKENQIEFKGIFRMIDSVSINTNECSTFLEKVIWQCFIYVYAISEMFILNIGLLTE